MTISTINHYPVIHKLSDIVKKGKAASHADGQARQLYLESFISAFAHAHDHGDNTIVTTIYDLMPKTSSYKSKVKASISLYTPLDYSNTTKTFNVNKEKRDGKWYKKAIEAAHKNPFFVKQDAPEKTFNADKELVSLKKRLEKMVKSFEEHSDEVDADTIVSLKLMLEAF